ncbi:retrotransposon-related protein [Tanacetum coccineum]|uniref:Retrotransposon-related protein n=1 Tax=Tanacetum coccineum TaxID=301880 RepID=A0ABQ5BE95_9ASTR
MVPKFRCESLRCHSHDFVEVDLERRQTGEEAAISEMEIVYKLDSRAPVVKEALEKTPLSLGQSSSQGQSTIQAVESLFEYQLKKILYEKMHKSLTNLTHATHQELFDALTWSMLLDEANMEKGDKPDSVPKKRDRCDTSRLTDKQQGQLYQILITDDGNVLVDVETATLFTDPVLKSVIESLQQGKERKIGSGGKVFCILCPFQIDIFMDFIEALLVSQGKIVIMVVVDRLSKYAHFIPLRHPFTAAQVARAFLDNIYKLQGLHSTILSNRDKNCHSKDVAMGNFPLCDAQGLIAATPHKHFDRKLAKQGNKVVVYSLIQWSNSSEEDANWELLTDLEKRFPEFDIDP